MRKMSSEALQALVAADTLAWIEERGIKNEKGKQIRVDRGSDFFFLEGIYRDTAREIVVRKCSQVGISTWAVVTSLHDGKFWGINQIHTLPTVADVAKFVPSKTNEIIKNNPDIRSDMGTKKNVDAVGQKQLGKAFLYYKGTFSERESIMLTSDRNWYDEVDKSNQAELDNYDSRMEGADSLMEKRYISTPTVPNFGIDAKFSESDQRNWRFICGNGRCQKEQHMEWPRNVDLRSGVYICMTCGKEITPDMIRAGGWKPRFPYREIHGYWINQMIVPWRSAADLVKEYKKREKGEGVADEEKGGLEYFFNHKLGLPYVNADSQIPASLIYQGLSNKEHLEVNSVIGVDVQLNELYAVLGSQEGVYGILRLRDDEDYIQSNGKAGKGKWDRLAEIMEVYDVRLAVIDGGFTPNEVLEFAARFPYRVMVNWYKDDPKKTKIIRYGDSDFQSKPKDFEEEVKILTDRTRMIDFALTKLKQGSVRFFFDKNSPAIKMLIEHMGTTYARTVTDRQGMASREWVSTGKDDLLHGFLYYLIALDRREKVSK